MLKRYWRLTSVTLVIIGVTLVLFFVWPQKKIGAELIFLDVGQGDAMLIKTPYGQTVLVDGGPDALVLKGLGRYLPWSDRSLSAVLLTHPHDDHLFGLIRVGERYSSEQIFTGFRIATSAPYQAWLERVATTTPLKTGQRLIFGPDCYLEVLSDGRLASNDNDGSLVTKFVYDNFSVLLPGDLGLKGENILLVASSSILNADILKIGHHGSAESSSEAWLKAVSPKLTVISVGMDNRYGHPSLRILNRLDRLGLSYKRTDQEGDIHVWSDGQSFVVK
ncbi:MBL fold metallo-hydrolase [Candidatus Falkowbacteria bacterium]|nr:MBL fold metallo-hydrolase [Candidatus Falkowbacteria bacterium]